MLSLEHNNSSRFVCGPWKQENKVYLSFLVYRMITTLIMLGCLCWSVVSNWNSGKWLIYLTHWTFFTLTLQIFLGTILILQAYVKQTSGIPHHSSTDHVSMPISYKLYWMIYNMVLPNVFSVSIVYWIFIYDPENKTLTGSVSLNYMMHMGNSIMAILELVFAGLPFRILHVVYPIAYDIIYMIFNYTYSILGGTDPVGKPGIYEQINWMDVPAAITMASLHMLLLILLHVLIGILTGIRSRMVKRFRNNQQSHDYSVDVPMIPIKSVSN